jgi:type I restriction enzyme S subunit
MTAVAIHLRPLGSCVRFLSGGTPSKARPEFWNGDIPWVSSGEMIASRIQDTPLHISEDGAHQGSRLVPPNTVLIVVRGMSLAKEFRVSMTQREVAFNQDLKALECEKNVDPEFLYYALLAQRDYIRELASEASHGTKRLETNVLAAFQLPVPKAIRTQRRMAAILSAYDDLIENNRRRMALLESLARRLHREWFDQLRCPGCENTRFVDYLPRGWEKRRLDQCAQFLSGGTPSKARAEFWQGTIPWVSSGELTTMRIRRTSLGITEEAVEAGSRLVPPETILAVVRGMSLAKEFRIGLAARPVAFNQDLKAIRALPGVDSLFLYHALDAQRDQIRDKAGEASHGTKKLDTAVLSEVPILVPPEPVQRQFRDYVAPLHAQWDNLDQQIEHLRSARDLLLPRLMSGEIAV